MRLLIATTIFSRHDLTRIVLCYYKRLQDEGMNIELLCCGSEGIKSEYLARECGWNYVHAPNAPLSQKHNILFHNSIKYNHDAIMLIGSDDLISREVIEYYLSIQSDCVLGFNTLHFYSVADKKLIYFKGFTTDRTERVTMGAGRLFPVRVLEKFNRTMWGDSKLNRGLDTITSRLLVKKGVKEVEIDLNSIPGAMILDVKTETNITMFGRLLVNCNPCDVQLAYDKFPFEMNLIDKL